MSKSLTIYECACGWVTAHGPACGRCVRCLGPLMRPVRVFREEDVRPLWEALNTISIVDNHVEDTATAEIALDDFPAPDEWAQRGSA